MEEFELIVHGPFGRFAAREVVTRPNLLQALSNDFGILAGQISVLFEALAVAVQQVWKPLLEERKEYLLGAGLQK